MDTEIPCDLDQIGFVFPVYFGGLPSIVANFLRNAHFPEQGSSYYFAVATNFGIVSNAIRIVSTLLLEKRIHLNYSAGIRMFGNSVTHYNMSKRVDAITRKSDKNVLSIVNNIKNNKNKKVRSIIRPIYGSYLNYIGRVQITDLEFNVNLLSYMVIFSTSRRPSVSSYSVRMAGCS